jgi:hypothetical protein
MTNAKVKQGNATISQGGNASIDNNYTCTVETTKGTPSAISISNPSRENQAEVFIEGFPSGLRITQNGEVIEYKAGNTLTLEANNPTEGITLRGDMKQHNVAVTNCTMGTNVSINVRYQ